MQIFVAARKSGPLLNQSLVIYCTHQKAEKRATQLQLGLPLLSYKIYSHEGGFPIISFKPISEWPTSKSFREPNVKLVRIDVIGTFWRAVIRELY